MKVDFLNVVSLHEHPEYLNDCSDLLNKQWKRSFSARVQSLEKSFKDLPDSLILIEESDGETRVVGHSRLTRVLEDNHGCWIGSVVIAEEKRKKGFGKFLMLKTEEYAKTLNFRTVYLNTHDQQGFYEHLGYIYCSPVSSISFSSNVFIKLPMIKSEDVFHHQVTDSSSLPGKNPETIGRTGPPPPPPPLPLSKKQNVLSNLGQYWMKKPI